MKTSLLINMKMPTEDQALRLFFFSWLTQLSMNFVLLINLKLLTVANFFLLNIAEQKTFSANKYATANCRSGPEVIKHFSCLTQLNMKFVLLINLKLLTVANSFLLNIAEQKISLLINMKLPTADQALRL